MSSAVPVSSVASATLPDERVKTCLVRRVRTWRFPKPKDGKMVKVKPGASFSQK